MPECWKMPVFISVHHRAERHLTDFLVRLVFIKNKEIKVPPDGGTCFAAWESFDFHYRPACESFNFHYFPACEAVSRVGISSLTHLSEEGDQWVNIAFSCNGPVKNNGAEGRR